MDSNLFRLSNRVNDEKTFTQFLYLLMKDREAETSNEKLEASSFYVKEEEPEWQCTTIEDFLQNATVWAEATENVPKYYSVPPNPWRRAAQILLAGKTKE